MVWRHKMELLTEIVLRVPPIFAMDFIMKISQGILPRGLQRYYYDQQITDPILHLENDLVLDRLPTTIGHILLGFLLLVFCFTTSTVLFLLSPKHLLNVYYFGMSSAILYLSHRFNSRYINSEVHFEEYTEDFAVIINRNFKEIGINILAQIFLALVYNYCRLEMPSRLSFIDSGFITRYKGGTCLLMIQPLVWRFLSLPPRLLQHAPLISVVILMIETKIIILFNLKAIVAIFRRAYYNSYNTLRLYGLQSFLENHWTRLNIPVVLRVFWLTRLAFDVTYICVEKIQYNLELANSEQSELSWLSLYLSSEDYVEIFKELLVSGCSTIIALLGMTSVISYITHYIGIAMATFVGSDNEEDRNMGTVSAILFFVLALQTGLTGLDREKRLERLYRNFCLLSTAILHFVHSMVHPLLMNLSASHSTSKQKHCRALAMCAFLTIFPGWFLYYLWSRHTISTWLLAVTAFSVEVIIKVIISLLVYVLFMIDAYRETFWEKLDDYVYYIKSTGSTIEFLFGIFLFCNGAWIMLFESGGTIRAVMMCIHAYFNIWIQAKEGWKVFMKRRTAVNKINSLPEATDAQLTHHNDVCAICYQDLTSARVTRCNHLFHGVCLRKWLYVQDCCPLCHELIYMTEQTQEVPTNNNGDANGDANGDVNGRVQHLHQE